MPDEPVAPTIADIVLRIAADPILGEVRKRDVTSDLRAFCRAAQLPPQACPLSPEFLRQHLFQLHERQLRVSRKRLRNIRASVRWCVRQYTAQPPSAKTLTPVWQDLYGRLPGFSNHRTLGRFLHFCSSREIPPTRVCAATFDDFKPYVAASLHTPSVAQYVNQVVYAWNKAVDRIAGWPPHKIRRIHQNRYALPWHEFPQSFVAETEQWLARQAGADPFDDDAPIRPVRPTTATTRRRQIRAMASALVHKNIMPAAEVHSLAVLVHHAKDILRFFLERSGNQPSPMTGVLANDLLLIARRWLKLPEAELTVLRAIKRRVTPANAGMTQKNRARLRQFESDRNKSLLLSLPAELMTAALGAGEPERGAALLAQMAFAIEVLLTTMIRIGNLSRIELGRHIVRVGDRQYLVFDPAEVKNEIDLDFEIGPDAARYLRLYLAKFHTVLGGGRFLFPGRCPTRPKDVSSLRGNVTHTVFTHTGLLVNPHLFRHIGGKLYLDDHPEGHEVVRRMLGHKSLATTQRSYAGMEQSAAARHFDQHVLKLRRNLRGGGTV